MGILRKISHYNPVAVAGRTVNNVANGAQKVVDTVVEQGLEKAPILNAGPLAWPTHFVGGALEGVTGAALLPVKLAGGVAQMTDVDFAAKAVSTGAYMAARPVQTTKHVVGAAAEAFHRDPMHALGELTGAVTTGYLAQKAIAARAQTAPASSGPSLTEVNHPGFATQLKKIADNPVGPHVETPTGLLDGARRVARRTTRKVKGRIGGGNLPPSAVSPGDGFKTELAAITQKMKANGAG